MNLKIPGAFMSQGTYNNGKILQIKALGEMVFLACIHAKTVQNDLAETKMIGIDIPECFPRTQTDTLAEELVHGFVAFPAE